MDTPEATADPDGRRGRPRIAFLSFSSGEYDARTARMARTALRAGYEVVVYARNGEGLPDVEVRDGYTVRRVPWQAWLIVPGLGRLRGLVRRTRRRSRAATPPHADGVAPAAAVAAPPHGGGSVAARSGPPRGRGRIGRLAPRLPFASVGRTVLMFPVRPLVWARQLDAVIEPADIYHGMWAGSLPALVRHSRRLGGKTIYDSRDVYMESRAFATAPGPVRVVLAGLERRWARRVDRVLTVNDAYADLIARQLGVRRPPVVRNCPERWAPPEPRPDRIREALRLPADIAIVLYQGQLISDRGIEQAVEAILEVDGAVLVLLGFGGLRPMLEATSRTAPYAGRVFLLPPVTPDELLPWTASADVSVMPIAPTSINHRYTTPQKLFESLAAGVPVVASDLPGMAEVVRDADAGVLCDPLSPTSIADAIRTLVDEPPAERLARRARVLAAAHDRYTWEAQEGTLLALYERLLGRPAGPG